MNKIHVLVVPSWYPNGADKLMGVYHKDFCKALIDDGRMKVNMLYVDRQGLSRPVEYIKMKKSYEEKLDGYSVFGRRMIDISKVSFDMQIKSYTKALIKAYNDYEKIHGKPDVIHAQVAVPAGYAACILGKKINVPIIITEHASYYGRFFTGVESKYNQVVMSSAKITCVGKFMCNLYKEKGIQASVLPNVVDVNKFSLPHKKRTLDRFNLISICALRNGKCIENVIDSVKILKDKIPNIHYTVVGDGELENFYKSYSEKAEMTPYVTFVGRKTHEEIANILTKSDCLVVASDFETFGIPAVEALAAGIPVVSTKCFGTQAFLDEKCSIMCEINDVADLTRAINEMYCRYNDFSQEYNKNIAFGFDSTRVASMAYKYYKELIK